MLTTKMNTYVSFKCLKGSSSHLSVAMVTLGKKTALTSEIVFCDRGFKITFVVYLLTTKEGSLLYKGKITSSRSFWRNLKDGWQ